MKKKAGIKRVFLTVLALLIFLVVMLWVALPSAVLWFVNNRLGGMLGAGTTLEEVDISLMRGRMDLRDFVLAQPAGFDGDSLLSFEKGRVQLDLAGIPQGKLFLSFSGEHISANLIRANDGALNVQSLVPVSTNDAPAEVGDDSVFRFALKHLSLVDAAFCYEDNTADDVSRVFLTNLNITAGNLRFFQDSNGSSNDMGSLDITGELVQPGESNAELLISSGIAPIAGSVPDIDLEFTLKGVLDQFLCDNLPDQFAILRGTGPFFFKLNAGFGGDSLNASFNMLGPDGENIVSFENMEMDFGGGTGSLQSLLVSAPERFGKKPLMRLAELNFTVDMNSLTGSPMVVNSIVLKKPEVNFGLDTNGLSVLDVALVSGTDDMDADSAAVAEESAPFSMVVEHFELSDGSGFYAVTAHAETGSGIGVKSLDFRMSDLGFSTGVDDVTVSITGAVLKFVVENSDVASELNGELTGLNYEHGVLNVGMSANAVGLDPAVLSPVLPAEYVPPALAHPFNFTGALSVSGKAINGSAFLERQDGGRIAEVERFAVDTASGLVGLTGLFVFQPDIAGNPELLRLADMEIKFDPELFSSDDLAVELCRINGFSMDLAVSNGDLNVSAFIPDFSKTGDAAEKSVAAPLDAGPGPDISASLSRNCYKKQENSLIRVKRSPSPSGRGNGVRVGEAISLQKLVVTNTCFSFSANDEETMRIALTNINVFATNLFVGADSSAYENGAGGFSAFVSLRQESMPDALLSVSGALTPWIPSVDLSFAVKGFDPSVVGLKIPAREFEGWDDKVFDFTGNVLFTNDVFEGNAVFKNASGRPIVSFGKVYLAIAEKSLVLGDVAVLQPSGFGSGVICSVAEIVVNAEPGQALTPLLRIKEMRVKQPCLFLVKNRDGVKNRDFFFYGARDDTSAAKVDDGSGTVPDVENKEGMTAVLETFYLENMEFRYEDNAVDVKNPLVIHATNINMSATNIVYSGGTTGGLPGTISLTGALVQQRGHDGFFGFFAETGPLSAAYPSLNAAVRIVGLELDTISSLIPTGSSKAIGGDALDVSGDIAIAPEMLDVRLKGKTVNGHTLPLLSLGGTPSAPDIRVSRVVLGIVSRLGGTVGNVARNITDASKDVAGSAVRTTISVGRAALQTVVSVGKGVFKTAHGVATADGSKVVGGLKETTVGSAREAFVTIYDITDDLVDDAAGAASSGIGWTQNTEWRENNFKRWENDWIQAVKKVRDMPYPPERGEPDVSFLSW